MIERSASTIDVANCDREPIHIPGSVQPHGVLLTLNPATLTILQAGGDTKRILGQEAGELLSRSVESALGTDAAVLIQSSSIVEGPEPLYLGSIKALTEPNRPLDLTAHRRDGVLILELEPGTLYPDTAAQMLAKVRRINMELEAAPDIDHLLQAASRGVRRLTRYDRVMIYRFFDHGSGSVEAEDKIDELDALLHHHYPASDIPTQARALYLRNLIRVIVDASYTPAPVVPAQNPATDNPLDMSDCSLRSVSPMHLQYLKNMGIAASMSVSIVVDGALWGLISCHHTAPKLVPYDLREACKYVGQILSQQIKAREEARQHGEALHLTAAREDLLRTLGKVAPIEQSLFDYIGKVWGLVPASGAAVLFQGKVSRIGHSPTDAQIRGLVSWLLASAPSGSYATNSLAQQYSAADAFAAEASGLLASVVSGGEPIVLLWFRAEQIETINWAGNPHKPEARGEELGILSPRKSFKTWKETVSHQSEPWSVAEVDAARSFARAVLDLRQQSTLQELNVQLRHTLSDKEVLLAQKDLLMQEVNHRVQNSLQLVNSMLSLQARQVSDPEVRAHFDEASRRIMAVSTVHRRLWRADHIHSVDFGIYLEELCDGLVETWGSAWAGQVKVHARSMLIPTNQAVVLALVVAELLTNAVKYAYDGKPGRIDVTVWEEDRLGLWITVKDQGVGIQAIPSENGLGSRLVRSLVGQLGGTLEVAALSPGTSVTLTVPVNTSAKAA